MGMFVRQSLKWLPILATGGVVLLAGCSTAPPPPAATSLQFADAGIVPQAALMESPAFALASPSIAASKPPSLPHGLANERKDAIAKVGKPYQVAGRWYYPKHDPDYDATGSASWYGPQFHGKKTANGETYNMNRLTAAHPTLPMPCYVTVTNSANGRTIVVRINDRGPYKRGRIIDLSKRAADLLGYAGHGTANVRVRYLRAAPLGADEAFEQLFLARQPWYRSTLASADAAPAPSSDSSAASAAVETGSIAGAGSPWPDAETMATASDPQPQSTRVAARSAVPEQ